MYTHFISVEVGRNTMKIMETFHEKLKSELITPVKPCACNFIYKYCFGENPNLRRGLLPASS